MRMGRRCRGVAVKVVHELPFCYKRRKKNFRGDCWIMGEKEKIMFSLNKHEVGIQEKKYILGRDPHPGGGKKSILYHGINFCRAYLSIQMHNNLACGSGDWSCG